MYVQVKNAPSLELLRCTDPYILKHVPLSRLTYICPQLDGLLLQPEGVRPVDMEGSDFDVYLCQECRSSLSNNKLPRLALNNHMFRGDLPDELQDVTWIEEMACALYRTTAHVTRLYNSSSPTDPLQLHGNACAHPLDVVNHANSLPWSPADLNQMLSVIFVGPRKLSISELNKLPQFIVRAPVIRKLYEHLRLHNRLYIDMPFDDNAYAAYPEYGILPGFEKRIVY
ncbi:hypothetical protein EV360DRAFT_35918, partial [Lentinula raphanica]